LLRALPQGANMIAASAIPTAPARKDEPTLVPSIRRLEHVVVLGANGTMGYGSGSLFTTAVPRVTFLARTKEKAEQGLAGAIKMVRSPTVADHVQTGSYDDMDRALADADLIFEAVTEDLVLKRQFFERIERARRPDSIVATVTSGLSINQLSEGRSDSFRRHFLGLHFFNPTNVIVGTELIPGKHTDPRVVEFIEEFARKKLGRVMIRTADRPGFAGNRVGFKVLNEVAQLAEEHGPLLMDRIVGPYTGRALSPLATVDLVGWDIHRAIVDNIHDNAPDEARSTLELPGYMDRLMKTGTLGNKSGRGFFRLESKKLHCLDPRTGNYLPASDVRLPKLGYIDEICALHRVGRYQEAMQAFVAAPGDEAALARKVIAGYISYAFQRVGEVTETITGIDLIMGFGFNWAPPSVLVDTIGLEPTIAMIKAADLPVPKLLAEALRARSSGNFFTHPTANIGRYFVAA
jgi:3-hydroxyacyl-CoA dehydrogenase